MCLEPATLACLCMIFHHDSYMRTYEFNVFVQLSKHTPIIIQ
jgi:hypothetical protein